MLVLSALLGGLKDVIRPIKLQGKDNKVYVLLSDEGVELRTLLGEDFMYKGTTVMRSIG